MPSAETKPVELSFETPAVHRDAVVIVGDAAYYKYGLLLARQLLEKEKDRRFDICVICSEPVSTPAELSEGLRIGSAKLADTTDFKTSEKITVEAYIRLFLASEMTEYRRLCYLDADVYLNRPGVQTLMDVDMDDQPLAAVVDPIVWGMERKKEKSQRYRNQIAKAPENYFNSGVLLIDVEKYNRTLLAGDISAMIAERASQLNLHDQTFLNMEFSHRVRLLSPIWNFPMNNQFSDMVDEANPVLLHFVGVKPWHEINDAVRQQYHSEYREFLSKHFGQTDFTPKTSALLPRSAYRKHKNPLREMISRKKKMMRIQRGKRDAARLWAKTQKRFPLD